jgi:hypothetical protein
MASTCGKHLSPACVENQWAGVDKDGMKKGNAHADNTAVRYSN